MKKGLFVILITAVLLCAFCTAADSEEQEGIEYLICTDAEALSLYEYKEGEPVLIVSGNEAEVFEKLLLPSRIVCDNIKLSGKTELPKGEYTLSGGVTLTAGAELSVLSGTKVSFSDSEFVLENNSSIRIKGGEAVLENSQIKGAAYSSVWLGYSASSAMMIKNGELLFDSPKAAIEVGSGRLEIFDGKIQNSSGAAILNSSYLLLCGRSEVIGIGADIETENGIHLSNEKDGYSSTEPLLVRYKGSFQNGTLTEMFYGAADVTADNLSVISENGQAFDLTYFESSAHTAEKNFLGVYLPYTVKIFDDGRVIYEEKKLSGEYLLKKDPDKKAGYNFKGYYKDEECLFEYSFEEAVKGDLKLYAKFTLEMPHFVISSKDFVYDGEGRELSFDSISHPLSDKGFFVYEWYKDGRIISNSASVSVKNVNDSGEYSCLLIFNCFSDSASVLAEGINVKITKAELDVPIIPPTEYTAEPQSPNIPVSELYSFSDQSFTDSGKYKIELTLTDFDNYRWKNSEDAEVSAEFEIKRAENRFITAPTVADVYFGSEILPDSKPLFGTPTYLYSESETGEYREAVPFDVGEYYLIARVGATENYTALSSSPVKFSILSERAVSISVFSDAEKRSYTSFESFEAKGLMLKAVYNSQREELIGLGKITITYQNGNSFLYGDTGVILSYDKLSVVYPVEVEKSEYDISHLNFSEINTEYDGKFHSFEYTDEQIVGKDGLPLTIFVTGGGSDAGDYEITVGFSSDSKEYVIPSEKKIKMKIYPKEVITVWENTVFTYDGKPKLPNAYYIDAFGVKRFPQLYGAAVSAGENYTANAAESDENYRLLNSECEYSILKADYDLSGVVFSGENYVYDGKEKTVTVSGLPEGVYAVGYTDNKHTDSGKYKLTVTLSYDCENYNSPSPLTHLWQILPSEYDMSEVGFFDTVSVYDGNIHYPRVEGSMPVGIDGSSPFFSFSGGATHVGEGRVAVKVIFESNSKNYDAPASKTLYVEIIPKEIKIDWLIDEYVYNGELRLPHATSSECAITVEGGGVDAGTYTAFAITENSDYKAENASIEYTIAKADNYFTHPLSAQDIYEGGTPSPRAEACFGEILFKFYSDKDCRNEETEPLSPGTYYCKAEVAESRNYKYLTSNAVSFEVIEVVPIAISAELIKDELRAFDTLSREDILLTVYNNDSSSALYSGEVSFGYINGDSLRKSDNAVSVYCEGLSCELAVTVKYADYDLSGVVWENTEHIYDGSRKEPTLTGLPGGVLVKEYSGAGSESGVYSVEALIEYDRENYNKPTIHPCELVIKKAELEAPYFDEVYYSGKIQMPKNDSELYTLTIDREPKNAGAYIITATVSDGKNYLFKETLDYRVKIEYTILPRRIELLVKDYDLYLYSEIGETEYFVIGGDIVEGESIKALQLAEGDEIIIRSLDGNYVFENNTAKINRINRLEPKTMEKILIISLLLILFILFVVILILNRGRLYARLLYLRECRKKKPIPITPSIAKPVPIPILPEPRSEEEREKTDCDIKEETKDEREEIILSDDPMTVDASHADELISDSLAKDLLKRSKFAVYTDGISREIINVDTLNKSFAPGEKIDVNKLKEKGLVSSDVAYIKVLARGEMNKPLSVYANDFSLAAIKMIALTGGEAVKVITVRLSDKKDPNNNKKN